VLNIVSIENPEDFQSLQEEWNELLESSTKPCIFLTWEWIHTWWRHLSGRRRLLILTVRARGGQLMAIAPFAIRPRALMDLTPFAAVEFLGMGNIGSDYLDVIVRQGNEESVCVALTEYLHRQNLSLRLGQLNEEFSVSRNIANRLSGQKWNLRVWDSNICPYIQLSGHTWDSYVATLGSEHRYNLRRKIRRLSTDFRVDFTRVETDTQRAEALGVLVVLHNLRWETRGGSDALNRDDLVAFHNEWTHLALARGWLRLFVLRLNGRPAAVLYGLRFSSTFYFYQSGFDPDCSKHSIGLVTLGLSIKSAIEEGASEYDMLHGDEEYKFHWARSARRLTRLELHPPNGRGLLCRAARTVRSVTTRMARHLLLKSIVEWMSNLNQSRESRGWDAAKLR
jgi:CelD/BcsL family acetyltransferase involved in cellulose biosynthesis